MKMCGMQLIPSIYPDQSDLAIIFRVILRYPTADFDLVNFLLNLYFVSRCVVMPSVAWLHE
jgi:hypothetical protein